MPGLEVGPRRPYRSPLKRSREGGGRSEIGHVKVARKWGDSPMPGVGANVHACEHPPCECARVAHTHAVAGGTSADVALRRPVTTIKRIRWRKAVQPTLRPNGTVELMREREVPLVTARGRAAIVIVCRGPVASVTDRAITRGVTTRECE